MDAFKHKMAELEQIQRLFEEKRKSFKEEMMQMAEQEMKLFEFELFYSLLLQNKETAQWVKERRKGDWEKALKEAGGDLGKAMSIFAS